LEALFYQLYDWQRTALQPWRLLAQAANQLYADPDVIRDPNSAGRQMLSHFATRTLDERGRWKDLLASGQSASELSPVAAQMPRSVGLAWASKLYRESPAPRSVSRGFSQNGEEVCFATIGNAGTSEGVFWESLNAAEVHASGEGAHQAMIDAQAAGQAAAKPGVTCAEVNRACRQPIAEAGYGPYFRHRMGHCIGMDVHERPFISEEDQTPLEVGMTFTDEPSIMWHGKVGVRIENIVVCEDTGGRKLNSYPIDLVASA